MEIVIFVISVNDESMSATTSLTTIYNRPAVAYLVVDFLIPDLAGIVLTKFVRDT